MKKNAKKNVWYLGLTSLFTDMSSEMIFPILPLFLANVLGVNKAFIGIIEGIAESTAAILKVVSGYISDRIRKRKALVALGYGFSAFSKPLFSLAQSGFHVLGLRFADRIGKGLRDAPRDALISESIKKKKAGSAFGIQRALDTLGAVFGTIITFLLLTFITSDYRTIFLLAVIPAIIGILIVIVFVKDVQKKIKAKLSHKLSLKGFDSNFKKFLFISILFNLGNFSYAFFILRAQELGVVTFLIPVIYLVYNIFYATLSYPAGKYSDKIGRKTMLIIGYLLFGLTSLAFAFAYSQIHAWLLFAMYGIQIAITDGVSRAFVSDLAPAEKKGVAFGVYHTVIGLSVLPASFIAGLLWDTFNSQATFLYGAVFGMSSAVLLTLLIKKK